MGAAADDERVEVDDGTRRQLKYGEDIMMLIDHKFPSNMLHFQPRSGITSLKQDEGPATELSMGEMVKGASMQEPEYSILNAQLLLNPIDEANKSGFSSERLPNTAGNKFKLAQEDSDENEIALPLNRAGHMQSPLHVQQFLNQMQAVNTGGGLEGHGMR